MKRTKYIIWIVLLMTLSFWAAGFSRKEFMTPPDSSKPWVYWFWVNGNLSREGITADLEAMKRVGIGGVIIMEVDKGEPKGSYPFASPEWREMFAFMLKEAGRLGLKVTMNNDGGWCGSGGPWVPVDMSMQKVVWSETSLRGPSRFEGTLAQPQSVDGYYEDITVLAFPSPQTEEVDFAGHNLTVTSNAKGDVFHSGRLFDHKNSPSVPFPCPTAESPVYVDFAFQEEVAVNGLTISLGGKNWELEGRLQVEDGDAGWADVKKFKGFAPSISIDFPEQRSGKFRILLTGVNKPGAPFDNIGICEVTFCHAGINCLEQKSMVSPPINTVSMQADYPDAGDGIAVGEVTDISDRMDSDGKIGWDVPPGEWTILRIGHTTTGKTNHTSPQAGVGYECDRLRQASSTLHFNNLIAVLADDSPESVGSTFVATHIDSWESGSQNWTPDFIDEFRSRRGYDPTPYLPVLAGKIIGNKEMAERFLWDFRLTISDLMLANYTDNIRKLAHEKGLNLSIEAYRRCLTDEMTYAGRADEPMAEFWAWPKYNFDYSCTQMASAAHVYGKKVVGAEAFTSGSDEEWEGHPANMKELGDWAFCQGINKFVIHRYAMQPYSNITPGMGMSSTGLHYERTQTWWEMSSAWHTYLSRCQYLLQQGLFVADMCLIAPEDIPQQWFSPYQRDSASYRFDACPPEAVLTRLSVKDGLVTLPDGMSYKILVMPDTQTMSPALLSKIMELVREGATLVGAPPRKGLGLADYPGCDAEVRRLASELWGQCDGTVPVVHPYGKGKVICGKTPEEVLEDMGVRRDFVSERFLRFIHKTIDGRDVYFIANPSDEDVNTVCRFRVKGGSPEIWDPVTGSVSAAGNWCVKDGYVEIPLSMEPSGSLFVVFDARGRKKAKVKDDTGTKKDTVLVSGTWEVNFTDGRGAPESVVFDGLYSWTEHPDPGIRYYSGAAVYHKEIDVPREKIRPKGAVILDLGEVDVMAEVFVNGKNMGILWKTPYRMDISGAVKPGKNRLDIKVVNLWNNRLVGDELQPDSSARDDSGELKEWPQWVLDGKSDPSGRYTFTTWKLLKADDPLMPSGLIGPVRILFSPARPDPHGR